MGEPHLLLSPRCFAKGCDQGFEGRVPDAWIGADISFVMTLYDSVRRPTKLLPMRVSTFFLPGARRQARADRRFARCCGADPRRWFRGAP